MFQAASSMLISVIPGSLNQDPKLWSPADVLGFLEANKVEYLFDDDDINTIRINKVADLDFLELTRERLCDVTNSQMVQQQ